MGQDQQLKRELRPQTFAAPDCPGAFLAHSYKVLTLAGSIFFACSALQDKKDVLKKLSHPRPEQAVQEDAFFAPLGMERAGSEAWCMVRLQVLADHLGGSTNSFSTFECVPLAS